MIDPSGTPALGSPAWLEALLRARLGPRAVLGDISFEGRLFRLRGLSIPLGANASLAVTEATIELGAGAPLGGLPLALRLVLVRAELRGAGAVIPISFDALADDRKSWALGTLRLGAIEAMMEVGTFGLCVAGSHVTGTASVSAPFVLSLDLTRAPVAVHRALPRDLAATGSIRVDENGMEVAVALATEASSVTVRGRATGRELHAVRVTGRLATIDLLRARALPVVPDAVIELDLSGGGGLDRDVSLKGRVFAREIVARRAGAPTLRIEELASSVEVSREGLRLRGLTGSARRARFGGHGFVPFGRAESVVEPLAAFEIRNADATLIAEVAAIFGRSVPLASADRRGLPVDLLVSGEGVVSADRSASGSFTLETARSSLVWRPSVKPAGELVGSTLRGRLGCADASAIGLFPSIARPRAEDVLTLDGRFTGTLRAPGITGRVAAPRLSIEAGPTGAVIVVDDASVLLDVGPDGLAWQSLSARTHGGAIRSSGRLARRTGALEASIGWRDVQVESIPIDGERKLGGFVSGACSGDVALSRASLTRNALVARGSVTLDDAAYPVVRLVSARLRSIGLPPLATRGRGPSTAKLVVERGELTVDPIAVALDGIGLRGTLRVLGDRDVAGRAEIHVGHDYLARSPLLAIPSAFTGELVIPIEFSGPASAPDVRTDVSRIVDGLLAKSRVAEALRELFAGLRRRTRGAGRPPRA